MGVSNLRQRDASLLLLIPGYLENSALVFLLPLRLRSINFALSDLWLRFLMILESNSSLAVWKAGGRLDTYSDQLPSEKRLIESTSPKLLAVEYLFGYCN